MHCGIRGGETSLSFRGCGPHVKIVIRLAGLAPPIQQLGRAAREQGYFMSSHLYYYFGDSR